MNWILCALLLLWFEIKKNMQKFDAIHVRVTVLVAVLYLSWLFFIRALALNVVRIDLYLNVFTLNDKQ